MHIKEYFKIGRHYTSGLLFYGTERNWHFLRWNAYNCRLGHPHNFFCFPSPHRIFKILLEKTKGLIFKISVKNFFSRLFFVCSLVYLFCSFVNLFVFVFIYLLACLFSWLLVRLYVCLFTVSFLACFVVCLFIYLFIYLSICLFVCCLFVRSFVYLFVCLFICLLLGNSSVSPFYTINPFSFAFSGTMRYYLYDFLVTKPPLGTSPPAILKCIYFLFKFFFSDNGKRNKLWGWPNSDPWIFQSILQINWVLYEWN